MEAPPPHSTPEKKKEKCILGIEVRERGEQGKEGVLCLHSPAPQTCQGIKTLVGGNIRPFMLGQSGSSRSGSKASFSTI